MRRGGGEARRRTVLRVRHNELGRTFGNEVQPPRGCALSVIFTRVVVDASTLTRQLALLTTALSEILIKLDVPFPLPLLLTSAPMQSSPDIVLNGCKIALAVGP